jgi:thioredoxin reductase (NADPH)
MDKGRYDVLIVGAGPIGIACGIEAQRRKLSHIVIEKSCLVNSIFHYPTNMTFFSTSDRLEIGDIPFISHGIKPTRREALEYYRRVASAWRLNVKLYEEVLEIKEIAGDFKIITTRGSYNAKTVIIATGYYDNANMLDIPGENLPKVKHYYNEPHPYVYQKVAVVGAGNSAVDVALELYRIGAEVTMIIRESQFKEGIKYWVKPDIENRINEGSIKAYFESKVTRIFEKSLEILTPNGKKNLKNDFLFAMTGYHPDYKLLKGVGVHISQDESKSPIYNLDSYETDRNGIYLAGVVCGGMETSLLFIENSREHPTFIFDHMEKNYLNIVSKPI